MDVATFVGIIVGFSVMVVAIVIDGNIMGFWDVKSILIVLGGTLATALICYPVDRLLSVFKVATKAFVTKNEDPLDIVNQLVKFAERARREGILALENAVDEVEDEFLKSGIRLAVDGVEPELIKDILETELAFIEDRHRTGQGILINMGTYAPAFGMIGTLIGLVMMLQTLDNPSTIGPKMAVALLTTLYGSVLANVLFLPLANKLKMRTAAEILVKEVTIEGVLSIQSGDNPRIVEQKLKAFLAPIMRETAGGEE